MVLYIMSGVHDRADIDAIRSGDKDQNGALFLMVRGGRRRVYPVRIHGSDEESKTRIISQYCSCDHPRSDYDRPHAKSVKKRL